MSDLTSGLAALNAARPAYDEAEAYYEGHAEELFTSTKLARALGSTSDVFSFNYARLVVQSRLSRMEVASVTTQDGSADEALADMWAENLLDQELQDAFEAALVYGDAYLIGEPTEDGFNVFYNSPLDVRVFYKTENPREKSFAIKRWITDDKKLRVNVYYADRIEKYISKGEAHAALEDGDFDLFVLEDGAWPEVNETGAIPVFHLRTSRQYGTPEHRQAYGPQAAITKLIATEMDVFDYSAAPQRYVLQDSTANSGVNPAADFGQDSDDYDGDLTERLKAGPGGIWNLAGAKSVGQFDPASPETFVTPFKTFIESMSTVTSTPMHAFNVGALPSGESLRAAEAPLNKRVMSIELLFGATLREMFEYALTASGYDSKVMVGWAPAATYDDADVWSTVKMKTDAGVPARVALMEAGYTDEQVSEWYPDDSLAVRTMADLASLGETMTKLASAVSLGLITREEARKAIPADLLIESEVADVESLPEVTAATTEVSEVNESEDIASKADALGVLIRAGVDPAEAAERVGLAGITFTGATPSSLRLPTADAAKLEEV